jgi:hypothetical protein
MEMNTDGTISGQLTQEQINEMEVRGTLQCIQCKNLSEMHPMLHSQLTIFIACSKSKLPVKFSMIKDYTGGTQCPDFEPINTHALHVSIIRGTNED